jgi:hypothetical protein
MWAGDFLAVTSKEHKLSHTNLRVVLLNAAPYKEHRVAWLAVGDSVSRTFGKTPPAACRYPHAMPAHDPQGFAELARVSGAVARGGGTHAVGLRPGQVQRPGFTVA